MKTPSETEVLSYIQSTGRNVSFRNIMAHFETSKEHLTVVLAELRARKVVRIHGYKKNPSYICADIDRVRQKIANDARRLGLTRSISVGKPKIYAEFRATEKAVVPDNTVVQIIPDNRVIKKTYGGFPPHIKAKLRSDYHCVSVCDDPDRIRESL